ncbi:FAD/NAD(P)-binding protein [Actinomadura nitritigenes]|uniref:FAD/NAD(P)-binding protein n=1 Tax=Actinomadura nitritigenes TaxID=134602 RepID=UPI003D8AFDF2
MPVTSLAIVGAGPTCTYVMERLAATVGGIRLENPLAIHVFDKSGEFGAGEVHSPRQPRTSPLNRTAGLVGFAADDSVEGAGELSPPALRPNLHQWCQRKFEETRDPLFDLTADDWPQRFLHGLALTDLFHRYIEVLHTHPQVHVHLHRAEVVDLQEAVTGLRVVTDPPIKGASLECDRVLIATGHTSNDPRRSAGERSWWEFSQQAKADYISPLYPLDRTLTRTAVPAGSIVACRGMGLSAVDAILFLTEGRGGRFEEADDGLRYVRSGDEPASIVAFSRSGLFLQTRPRNAKASDLPGLVHRGRFLTEPAVEHLRAVERSRPLDFELHLLPLIALEMCFIHYRTQFGPEFGLQAEDLAQARYRRFLLGLVPGTPDARIRFLLGPIEDEAMRWAALGDPAALDRFQWDRVVQPIEITPGMSSEGYRDALLRFLADDIAAADRGNLADPAKAAADGVWRDLRPVISHAIDHGGLTAGSHDRFLRIYLGLNNRLVNGPSGPVAEKIRALVRDRLVDPGLGPGPTVDCDEERGRFRLSGSIVEAERHADVLIDARVHRFDPAATSSRLHANLYRRGMVRKWRNNATDGPPFEPGGIELTEDFNPVDADGRADLRLAFLGPYTDGITFFRLGAPLPHQNHHVMRNAARWTRRFWSDVASDSANVAS